MGFRGAGIFRVSRSALTLARVQSAESRFWVWDLISVTSTMTVTTS